MTVFVKIRKGARTENNLILFLLMKEANSMGLSIQQMLKTGQLGAKAQVEIMPKFQHWLRQTQAKISLKIDVVLT